MFVKYFSLLEGCNLHENVVCYFCYIYLKVDLEILYVNFVTCKSQEMIFSPPTGFCLKSSEQLPAMVLLSGLTGQCISFIFCSEAVGLSQLPMVSASTVVEPPPFTLQPLSLAQDCDIYNNEKTAYRSTVVTGHHFGSQKIVTMWKQAGSH